VDFRVEITAFNDQKLKSSLSKLIINAYKGRTGDVDLYSNTLDCFSAVVDSVILDISLEDWLELEKQRQTQKTLQNIMGDIHQEALGSSGEWESLGVGKVVDLVNHKQKIIAEIKNKHNTTKGNHKVNVYDDLAELLPRYPNYTGYYVEILPHARSKVYNSAFMPPDNRTKRKRPKNDRIRKIDGRSFYSLVTGYADALDQFYYALPSLVVEILSEANLIDYSNNRTQIGEFQSKEIFKKAYG
tara:strand:+ start:2022 stop:2750 length:729 start_codon:yes stop_codon:yes gene_type:complete